MGSGDDVVRESLDGRVAPAGSDEMVKIFARIGLEGPFWDPKSDQWQSAA